MGIRDSVPFWTRPGFCTIGSFPDPDVVAFGGIVALGDGLALSSDEAVRDGVEPVELLRAGASVVFVDERVVGAGVSDSICCDEVSSVVSTVAETAGVGAIVVLSVFGSAFGSFASVSAEVPHSSASIQVEDSSQNQSSPT